MAKQQNKGFRQVGASQYKPQIAQAATTTSKLNSNRWAPVLLLLPILLLAWYLLSMKLVRLDTLPAQVDVSLDSLPYLFVGGKLFVHAGTYPIKLSAEGYRLLATEITVTGEGPAPVFSFELDKLPGRLMLNSTPAGAAVHLDNGSRLGVTPLTIEAPAGAATLTFNLEKYASQLLSVDVIGLNQTQSVLATLKPNWGEIIVNTEPKQASLWLDGYEYGFTPGSFQLSEGNRTIEIRHPEYASFTTRINLKANESLRLPPIKLARKSITFSIISEPKGANVSVNGRYLGQTPMNTQLAGLSDYQLTVQKSGYQTHRESVSLEKAAVKVNVRLKPVLGMIHIKVKPPTAAIAINGQHQGTGDMTLSLPATEQRVTVTHQGYTDYSTRVALQPALAQTLNIQLKTLTETRRAGASGQYKNSQGQDFRLVQANLVTMGASRGEPGFQRNQIKRQVQLTQGFYIGLREVSNAEYRKFMPMHNSGAINRIDLNLDAHPAVNLSWLDAARYCNWLSKQEKLTPAYIINGKKVSRLLSANGYRLPVEAEWVWVARQPHGGSPITFPWGNSRSPTELVGNFAEAQIQNRENYLLPLSYKDGYKGTAPGGRFKANELGLFDLAGNASEWIDDDYVTGSLPGAVASFKVIRGSSWQHSFIRELRLAYRRYGYNGEPSIGFRLARTP